MEASGSGSSSGAVNKTTVGVAIVAVAGGLFAVTQLGGGDSRDDDTATCTLGATGLTAVASGFARTPEAAAVIAAAGPTVSTIACRQFVEALAENPQEDVEFELETPEGGAIESVSREKLTTPAAPPPQAPPPNIVGCFAYTVSVLRSACLRGTLPPPANRQVQPNAFSP